MSEGNKVEIINPLQAYSVKKAAEIMGCTPRHVYALIEEGQIEAFLIGKKGMRVRAVEIQRWQESKKVRRSTRLTDTSSDDAETPMSRTVERLAASVIR